MGNVASALFTDLYELTMMQGYLREGLAERRACFDLFFRQAPFRGAFALTAGLDDALRFLRGLRFTPEDLAYLVSLKIFDGRFLDFLRALRFSGDIEAMPEGTVAGPYEPILRVTAPLGECQLVESALLNIVNFQTLIATKAARVCRAAAPGDVLDFGMRRAQGPDGALAASRAAYLGGCAGTSNVEAGAKYGIPTRGTHAHSWVMAFPDELTAFRAYARHYPDGTILLVDTYDTLGSGVPNAITVAGELAAGGHRLLGIRLDSGDLTDLARRARRLLDEAGAPEVKIIVSGDLDEHRIAAMRAAGAPIDAWGVGTRLVTAHDEPALTGVYKLAAWRGEDGVWHSTRKESDTPAKATLPGVKQVWRVAGIDGNLLGDLVELAENPPDWTIPVSAHDLLTARFATRFSTIDNARPLLIPVMREGAIVTPPPALDAIRSYAQTELASLADELRALDPPSALPVFAGPALAAAVRDARTAWRG